MILNEITARDTDGSLNGQGGAQGDATDRANLQVVERDACRVMVFLTPSRMMFPELCVNDPAVTLKSPPTYRFPLVA